jgi:hypothetical protein
MPCELLSLSPAATPMSNIAIESTMIRDMIGIARARILAHIAGSLKAALPS